MPDNEPLPHHREPVPEEVSPNRTVRRLVMVAAGVTVGTVLLVAAVVAAGIAILAIALSDFDLDFSSGGGKDGTDSQRLAVEVTPSTDLRPGDHVKVTTDAFSADAVVAVTVCLREADTLRRGLAACDEVQGSRYAVGSNGKLAATYVVPRSVTIRGQFVDCAGSDGRCLVVAADIDDYNRSGGRPISFRRDLPSAETTLTSTRPHTDLLPVTATPQGPAEPGATLRLEATGFEPNEPLLVAWCTDGFETLGIGTCEPTDQAAAFSAIALGSLPDAPRADAEGRAVIDATVRSTIEPTSSGFNLPGEPAERRRSDGRFDCRTSAGRCSIVIAAAADTKRSAVLPYEVLG